MKATGRPHGSQAPQPIAVVGNSICVLTATTFSRHVTRQESAAQRRTLHVTKRMPTHPISALDGLRSVLKSTLLICVVQLTGHFFREVEVTQRRAVYQAPAGTRAAAKAATLDRYMVDRMMVRHSVHCNETYSKNFVMYFLEQLDHINGLVFDVICGAMILVGSPLSGPHSLPLPSCSMPKLK